MDRGRAAAALLALAACIACSAAAPTSSDQTALEVSEGPSSGCYYNFQHYGEGDRIMTNEPCLNCTCHNRMLMCYLRVCPFTKPIGQDCTIEKRADQCCPIVTCPDVPVDLLTSTSTSSPAEYGATGLGKLDKYGCSINGKYFPEGSKVPPSPNKPCEHCYCIRNMTTCVMQECTLHVDGCTPIYHKDVCCPVRYSCDHPEDEIPLLDDMTTTVRPTPGFLLTTTTMLPVTQPSQNCVHDDQIVPDGALIKTEKACEHCYCMKGDIVCVVQECGTPMENEGKNCTSLPPRQGQCCPDTYICEGDELTTEETTAMQELTTTPPRRFSVEGSGYRLEPDETYTEIPSFVTEEEGSGEEHLSTVSVTEKSFEKPTQTKETSTAHDILYETSTENKEITNILDLEDSEKHKDQITTEHILSINEEEQATTPSKEYETNVKEEDHLTTNAFVTISDDIITTETPTLQDVVTSKVEKTTRAEDMLDEATLKEDDLVPEKEHKVPLEHEYVSTTPAIVQDVKTTKLEESTTLSSVEKLHTDDIVTLEVETQTTSDDLGSDTYTTTQKFDELETTPINPIENEIHESDLPIYSPGRIPGEGDCLLNSITYQNNSVVPSTNNCHTSCRCISSIVKCEPIVCSAPPEYMSDCQPIYDSPESCCPTYVCSTKETIPPESHNQMSESESAKPVLASECNSPDCKLLDNKFDSSDCSNNECVPKDKVSCDGEKCKVDLQLETHPDLHHDEPVECSAESGCTKPVDTHTGNDCTNGNCNILPSLECTGSDCDHEIPKVTSPEETITTSQAYPTTELTEKSETTDKTDILHGSEKEADTSTQGLNIETQPITEYVTVPIKSITEISATESSQSEDITSSHGITESPEHHTASVDIVQTVEISTVSEIETDLTQEQQSTLGPMTTGSNDNIKYTIGQTTASTNEQVVTESQTVTLSSYETKPVEPVTEEISVAHSPEPHKETIIPTDQVSEVNVDVTTLHTISLQDTTESILKETITSHEPMLPDVVQEDTGVPEISASTVSDNMITEKIEISTMSYPTETESEHKVISKLDEQYTKTPSSIEYDKIDKATEPVSVTTESSIKITDKVDYADDKETGEYKPVSDDNGNEIISAPEVHTELPPISETTTLTELVDTTELSEVTEKSDQDHVTKEIEEQTETSLNEHKEIYTESITTDAKVIYENPTTDSVTSVVLRDKEGEDTNTEAIPTETILGGVSITQSSETVQEAYTSRPEITTTEIKTSTESGYHYHSTSPGFDEKVETTALPVDEVPFRTTTESKLDVTSGTGPTEITEKEVQDSQEFSTTRPQEQSTEDIEHKYITTEESYEASSHPSTDKDISVKPGPPMQVEEIATTEYQEELPSTERVAFETSKVDEQQVSVEASTASYHEVTTNKVTLPDTMYNYETIHPSITSVQPETDTKLQTTEANKQYDDTQTTESEIKVIVDDTLGTNIEPHIPDIEPHTEKIESDEPTKAVTYTEEASTRVPNEEVTEKPSNDVEEAYEKTTEISEPVTDVSQKADTTTTRVIEIDSETKTPETYVTSVHDIIPDVSTAVPGTSEYGTKDQESETPYISTTPKAMDVNVEITTIRDVTEETYIEQHTEMGSGQEDTITKSSTPPSATQNIDLKQEIPTSEISTSSSVTTESPLEENESTREHIETTPATYQRTTQSNVDMQTDTTSPSEIASSTAAKDITDESTPTISNVIENTLQTRKPEGLEPELITEKTIKENTESLPEHDNQQTESTFEVSTPISIHEEPATTHSSLSLVTEKTENDDVKPYSDVTSSVPVQDKDTYTTESLFVDQGLSSTEKLATKEPETVTTYQQVPSEGGQTTLQDEKIFNTNLSTHPDAITEYPERTTASHILNEDNEIPNPPVTEVSQTILPETTYESQSVIKESTTSHAYEITTQKLLENVTEKKEDLEETTKSPTYSGDEYETTSSALLETEPERQSTTKEPMPDIGEYGTTLVVDVDSEKDDRVTITPTILSTKQTTELPQQTENVPNAPTNTDISQEETTSISPITISAIDLESQSPTSEQTEASKEPQDVTTTIPIEKVPEIDELTTEVPLAPIDTQTEKEILREPNKDMLETTTLVTIGKQEDIEDKTLIKETTIISSYESTTLNSLKEETEYPSIAPQTTQEELHQPTTSRVPEKDAEMETDSGIPSIVTTLDTSGLSSSTPTNKLPEYTSDVHKSTEPVTDYSETTPYLIELQEHAHQPIDESSSKMPIDEESTTEHYISEHPDRGDIPHKDDDINEAPTSQGESMDVTTLKEDKSVTTPKSIHDEMPTEIDQTTSQSPSETPIEENKYSVLPIETEKPLSTSDIEAHTEKHIPSDDESHKPDISDDAMTSTEEVPKATMPSVFTKPSEEPIIPTEELDKHEEKPVESTEASKPESNEPSDDLPTPDFSPSGVGGYGQEPDYGDNEDQAFGPGTCRYGGKVYVSAQQIPRDDPCDFCFCFRSDIICLQQSCPPPIHGCHEEPIQGFCCPRYECPVSMATTLNVTTTTTTTTTTLPPHFLPHAYKGAAQRRGCQIKGHTYKVGEVVRASSGPCLHCTCGGDGQMKCDPKACTPEPMLRQMIAAAVSSKRRR